MGQIEKAFGRGAIMKLGDEVVDDVEVIPTGSIALNHALGVGGYPRGRIIANLRSRIQRQDNSCHPCHSGGTESRVA